ncbi:MAG TPA: DNA/RNA non-specific endonuclease [Bacteroidales bacterium]|nr:DNA/RNA non-specific endonuclease [Bacteroidales bacterium]
MLVSAKQLRKETNVSQEKRKPFEVTVLKEPIVSGAIIGESENLKHRRDMISAVGFEPTDFAFERAIGNNDSLYSNFAELIALTKRKVGRIVQKEDNKITGYATGFMVSKSLMLTNWHVFKNKGIAEESEVHFFYEYDMQGHPLSPVIFSFDTTQFFNNEDLDYCFVAVKPFDVSGRVSLQDIGYLFLDGTLGKIGDKDVECLNIIHHPQGDYKQISIRENTFVDIDETKIMYKTDTAPGSSGSPVFNDQWQVVGLHHKSIAKMSSDGQNYLDKNDLIIPIIDDKIDVTRIVWEKNEGIRISVILKHIFSKNPGNASLKTLTVPPLYENLEFVISNSSSSKSKTDKIILNDSSKNLVVSIPTAALDSERSIELSLSSKLITKGPIIKDTVEVNKTDDLLLEVAKAEKENAVDFSKCRGYDSNFLGVAIPLPQPKNKILKQIAMLKDKTIELKYFNYSIIFNAVFKMPLISAVNVEGDASKRLDDSKRNDDWLRDNRIDIECQLFDKFYSKSNFDKGHMSRFEDANWGDTKSDALRNGIHTCFYTNACPQVVALNRAAGIWGKLEKAVLEKGITKEAGKQAKMTVFNGPIFNEEKDRIFKGVVIPIEFYKVIVWLDDNNKPKATAFKLSQEMLVDPIKFDESMRVEQEALDIDKDVKFKNFQCSIKMLSRLTNIDFKALEKFDTFKTQDGSEEFVIESTDKLVIS